MRCDGKEVEVKRGTTVLQAAKQIGIDKVISNVTPKEKAEKIIKDEIEEKPKKTRTKKSK